MQSTTIQARRAELCSDMLTTAIEGGIAYWAIGRKFQRITEGEREGEYTACELKPHNDEGEAFEGGDKRNDWQFIDVEKIAAACELLAGPDGAKLASKDITKDIRDSWADPDICSWDADTADVVVQIAMFGEIVFG